MESITYFKNIRIPATKLRLLLPSIKRMKPVDALDYLFYYPNKPAKIFHKLINSALDSAKKVLKVDANLIKFKVLLVEEGHKIKRYRPGPRGMVNPIKKRFSHVKVILEPISQTSDKKQDINSLKKPQSRQAKINK